MKRLYAVRDIPSSQGDYSNYCYIVKAGTEEKAIEIVKQNTGHVWDWEASLADNAEVWE